MASQSEESEMLMIYSSEINERLVHPWPAALLLYKEGVVSEEVVNEVADSTKKHHRTHPITVDMEINSRELTMELDTGVAISIISGETQKRLL